MGGGGKNKNKMSGKRGGKRSSDDEESQNASSESSSRKSSQYAEFDDVANFDWESEEEVHCRDLFSDKGFFTGDGGLNTKFLSVPFGQQGNI